MQFLKGGASDVALRPKGACATPKKTAGLAQLAAEAKHEAESDDWKDSP